jgi:hypothetical protein
MIAAKQRQKKYPRATVRKWGNNMKIKASSLVTLMRSLALAMLAALPANAATTSLWASSSEGTNPSSLFTVDAATGAATLVGSSGLGNKLSAIAVDPADGTLYGIRGSACTGARLITINPATGAGTIVGVLVGPGFDATVDTGSGNTGGGVGGCTGGSDALVFGADGTLYAGGWNGGTYLGGSFLTLNKATGAVLSVQPTAGAANIAGLARAPDGTLWVSRGSNGLGLLHTIDPSTGQFTATLSLSSAITISDIAFGADGKLYGAVPNAGELVTIDTLTGTVTVAGFFGNGEKIAGLAPKAEVLAATCAEPGGCQLGGQTIVLPPGLSIPEGTIISSDSAIEFDWRPAADKCGIEPLTLFADDPDKPNLYIPNYLCAAQPDGRIVVLAIETDLDIPDGTVDIETDAGVYFGADALPCDAPFIPPGVDPTRGQDVTVWQTTDAADLSEAHALEVSDGCGSSRGKTKGLSYFVVGMRIDCGIDGLVDPEGARQCLIDLTKVKLYGMLQAIKDAKGTVSRRQYRKFVVLGGLANVAYHLRLYKTASKSLGKLIQQVEAADFDTNATGNPRGNILFRAYNGKFMTDVKTINLQP